MGEGREGGGGDSAEDYAAKQTNILAHANVSLLADEMKSNICPVRVCRRDFCHAFIMYVLG